MAAIRSRDTKAELLLRGHLREIGLSGYRCNHSGLPGKPDVVIPSVKAYNDPSYPDTKLFIVGVKTTCKDRWRQVLSEAPQIRTKHLLTLQEGISPRQLEEMHRNHVVLVVPKPLHDKYPTDHRIRLLGLDAFIASARKILA